MYYSTRMLLDRIFLMVTMQKLSQLGFEVFAYFPHSPNIVSLVYHLFQYLRTFCYHLYSMNVHTGSKTFTVDTEGGKFADKGDGKFVDTRNGKFADKEDVKFADEEDVKFADKKGLNLLIQEALNLLIQKTSNLLIQKALNLLNTPESSSQFLILSSG